MHTKQPCLFFSRAGDFFRAFFTRSDLFFTRRPPSWGIKFTCFSRDPLLFSQPRPCKFSRGLILCFATVFHALLPHAYRAEQDGRHMPHAPAWLPNRVAPSTPPWAPACTSSPPGGAPRKENGPNRPNNGNMGFQDYPRLDGPSLMSIPPPGRYQEGGQRISHAP